MSYSYATIPKSKEMKIKEIEMDILENICALGDALAHFDLYLVLEPIFGSRYTGNIIHSLTPKPLVIDRIHIPRLLERPGGTR